MRLSTCLHPQRIYNKYLGKYIFVPCGKCESCRNIHAHGWISRLVQESQKHKYNVFFTLTYDEQCLPRFVKKDDLLVSVPRLTRYHSTNGDIVEKKVYDGLYIPISEIDLSDPKDMAYFYRYSNFSYPCVQDLQLFFKRLRYYIHEFHKKNVSPEACAKGNSERIKYYAVFELSPLNHRYHIHGNLFLDSPEVAKEIEGFIRKSWLLCDSRFIDVQFSDSESFKYVAKYLNGFGDLPTVYRHSYTRPLALFSRRPFIGHGAFSFEEIREIVNSSKVCVPFFDNSSKKVVIARNSSSFENRYFPRCYGFGFLTDSARNVLYRVVFESQAFEFDQFKDFIFSKISGCNTDIGYVFNFLRNRVMSFVPPEDFEKSFDSLLYRVFCISKRVLSNAFNLGFSLDSYIQKIYDYWDNVEKFKLNNMYSFCESYCEEYRHNDPKDLMLLYSNDIPDYVDNLVLTDDYIEYFSLNKKIANDLLHNKERKAYKRAHKYGLKYRVY